MCAIVGYVGGASALPLLVHGLRSVEYRGYDSAGIGIVSTVGNVLIQKAVGRLPVLEEKLVVAAMPEARIGIGHTRWASHGVPNEANAHPHSDSEGKIALVHNGLVENYVHLRKQLWDKGHKFKSQTDTEVLAVLVGDVYKELLVSGMHAGHSSLFQFSLEVALRQVIGTYSVAAICADEPTTLVVSCHRSPMHIGIGKKEFFVASDPVAFPEKKFVVRQLTDGVTAAMSPDPSSEFEI